VLQVIAVTGSKDSSVGRASKRWAKRHDNGRGFEREQFGGR
jgi:hypothetical protein